MAVSGTAVVTGGTGKAIARELASSGDEVFVIGRDAAKGANVVRVGTALYRFVSLTLRADSAPNTGRPGASSNPICFNTDA